MHDSKSNRWYPHATVATIVEKENRFLLVEEIINGTQKVLNQPAGHVENGETLFQAGRRETQEETGWSVELDALLGLYVYRVPDLDLTFHRVTFIANTLSHNTEQELDEGILQAVWMTRDEVAENQHRLRSHLVLDCIDDYLAGKRYPLNFIYDQLD